MTDDSDSKPVKRVVRLGGDPRDVIGDRRPTPRVPRLSDEDRHEHPRKTPPAGVQAALEQGAPLAAPPLAAPHEVDDPVTGAHPLMTGEELVQLEEHNSYRRIKRMSEQNAILFKMNIEQSRAIIAMAKSRSDVETKGLEAQLRIAEKRANTEIEDQVESHKWWRSTTSTVIAWALAGTGGLLALAQKLGGC